MLNNVKKKKIKLEKYIIIIGKFSFLKYNVNIFNPTQIENPFTNYKISILAALQLRLKYIMLLEN
mgnify:CR=1 FL=1